MDSLVIGLILAWLLLLPASLSAQVVIDSTYGTNGMARFNIDWYDEVIDLELYQDSILYILAETGHQDTLFDQDYSLLKVLPNGNLDSSFANNGIGQFDFGNTDIAGPRDLLIQPDGKLLIVGEANTFVDDSITPVAIARHLNDGSIDSTFGDNGVQFLRFISLTDEPFKIALQPDGKIVCTGATYGSASAHQELPFVTRLHANGSVDSTFGGTGKIAVNFGLGLIALKRHANGGFFTDMHLLSDGSMLMVGAFYNTISYQNIVAKFSSLGVVDSSFGNNGYWAFNLEFGTDNYIQRSILKNDTLYLQFNFDLRLRSPDYFVGIVPMNTVSPELIAINENDYVESCSDIALLSDGSLITTGNAYDLTIPRASYRSDFFTLARTVNGQQSYWKHAIDDSFANGGQQLKTLPNGKVIIAGFVEGNPATNQSDIVLMKVDPGVFIAGTTSGSVSLSNAEPFVSLYPNPSSSSVNVKVSAGEAADFSLYNLMGELILEQTLTQPETNISFNLASGVYVYKVLVAGKTVYSDKLIVVK